MQTEITGVAKVRIGEKGFKCLRKVWMMNFEKDGLPLKLAELVISEQGRIIPFDDTTVAGLTIASNLKAILS